MSNSSSETHDPFVVASLIGVPSSAIVGVTAYGAATGAPWRFVTVELDDGTSAISCTDLIRLVDVGQRTIDQPSDPYAMTTSVPPLLDQALQLAEQGMTPFQMSDTGLPVDHAYAETAAAGLAHLWPLVTRHAPKGINAKTYRPKEKNL